MSESILWNEMGNLHMRLGSYEDAVSAYGNAIALSPDFSMAYNNLGHAYFSKGDYEGAIPLLKKSIDLSNSAQEQAIIVGQKVLHGTVTDRILRLFDAVRSCQLPVAEG